MTFSHPLSKYGLALVLNEEELSIDHILDITPQMLIKQLREGLNHFRIYTQSNLVVDEILVFDYMPMQFIIDNEQKGDTSKGIYLSPNIITTDFQASKCWVAILTLINELSALKDKRELITKRKDLTQSLAPISGKFNNGSNSQTTPKSSLLEVSCCAIATISPIKPYRLSGLTPNTTIPDLDVPQMIDFIKVFKLVVDTQLKELLKTKIYRNDKTEKNKKPSFRRPPIINGNYPDAPRSESFGSIALLGAIGNWASRAENTNIGKRVLETLKDVPIYTISYGNAFSANFNHYVIELAKENELSKIVQALLQTNILSEDRRTYDNTKYQLFDMLASRFLQLFSVPAFKDFLSIRAEYQPDLTKLFINFFTKNMENEKSKITIEIVESAQELGAWLNKVAYYSALSEVGESSSREDLNKAKSKNLIQLESAIFSAKNPSQISNVITIAGRLVHDVYTSNSIKGKHKYINAEPPADSDLFIKSVFAETIEKESAKLMLMAFLRIRSHYETKVDANQPTEIIKEAVGKAESEAKLDAQS